MDLVITVGEHEFAFNALQVWSRREPNVFVDGEPAGITVDSRDVTISLRDVPLERERALRAALFATPRSWSVTSGTHTFTCDEVVVFAAAYSGERHTGRWVRVHDGEVYLEYANRWAPKYIDAPIMEGLYHVDIVGRLAGVRDNEPLELTL